VEYVPEGALLVRMDEVGVEQVSELPQVEWIGAYLPEYKVSRHLMRHVEELRGRSAQQSEGPGGPATPDGGRARPGGRVEPTSPAAREGRQSSAPPAFRTSSRARA
jgi:hypothetical protein